MQCSSQLLESRALSVRCFVSLAGEGPNSGNIGPTDTNAYANLVAPSVYDGGPQVGYPLARKAEESLRDIPDPDNRNVANGTI
jgi:hypothetical protein